MELVSAKLIKDVLNLKELPTDASMATLDPSGWVFNSPGSTKDGTHVILNDEMGQCAALALVTAAKKSDFQKITQLSDSALEKALVIQDIWISPQASMQKILPMLLYCALRRGRIWGMTNVVMLIPEPNPIPVATKLNLRPLDKVGAITHERKPFVAMAQRIDYSAAKINEFLDLGHKKLLPEYFAAEIVETYAIWLEKFMQGSWARSIIEERISKEQYICSLYNLHQYVKHTTRICARCVAHSEDVVLRNHYIHHLKGEINHELIIENDLKTLGADVDYLKTQHVPLSATNEFISIQESTIGFKQDPILMLACPLVAEGITANLRKDFVDHLYASIRSWGINEPEKAAKFITSHINFDGGEDGHWLQVVATFKQFVRDEVRLQQFLCVMQTAMNGMERGFNASVDELKLWELAPNQEG